MKKRVVLITGGSGGIGQALIAQFKSAGYFVGATSRTEKYTTMPDFSVICDVKKPVQVLAALKSLIAKTGRLDVLINNAGVATPSSLDPDDPTYDFNDHIWDEVVQTNLGGVYYFSKAAFPFLKLSKAGRLINIASILGLTSVADQPAYCAAKHAVVGLTKSLALAWAPHQITVNAICPGWVDTPMADKRFLELGITKGDAAADVSTGRITTPQEVAELAEQMAHIESGHITGRTTVIDGGQVYD